MSEHRQTELFGRTEETSRLIEAADLAVERGAQMVLVSGDGGIGKSALCDAALDRLARTGWGAHVRVSGVAVPDRTSELPLTCFTGVMECCVGCALVAHD